MLTISGLPRLRARLPSRNWSIFFAVTGGFASAIFYDKYQTRRNRQKWCDLVSHLNDEALSNHQMPRRVTIYLAAPPGDGLRYAREHFHEYIKPVLVAGAMDWDVVEGRKEGDVRHKTAEKVRKRRRKGGEGELGEEFAGEVMVEEQRKKNGTHEWDGVGGDIVVGRHTWKEYLKGLHEGWLGPVEVPQSEEEVQPSLPQEQRQHVPGQLSLGDTAVQGAANAVSSDLNIQQPLVSSLSDVVSTDPAQSSETSSDSPTEEKKEEKPKPRQPPPYIQPSDYDTASLSTLTPDLIGPSVGISMPHILGFRHTPLRMYRFLTRRHLADDAGRDVASAVMASYRPYDTVDVPRGDDAAVSADAGRVSEASRVLDHEEKDWYKLVNRAREPHEESVWIDDVKLDERLAQRMRAFQLTAEDEDRAKRIGEGKEKVRRIEEDEG